MAEYARIVSAVEELRADTKPDFMTRALREWPDALARSVIVATGLALFWLTWAHWGSIQIDCGREVYVPYEILKGKLLYRDLWYPYGPLEPYISALLLKIFGEHLSVLYTLGLSLAIACALALFELGKMLGGRIVGAAAALALLFQGFRFTIFNYIFPYSYSAPLGLLFSLLCLYFALRYVLQPANRHLIIAGTIAGLNLLTKQEMGVACYILLGFVLIAEAAARGSMRGFVRGAAACIPGAVLAVAVYGWFFWKVSPETILYANWQYSPGGWYMHSFGPRMNAAIGLRFEPTELLFLIANGGAAAFAWYLIAKVSRRRSMQAIAGIVLALGALLAVVHVCSGPLGRADNIAWYVLLFPRGMFFIGVGFMLYSLRDSIRHPTARKPLAEAALAVFALVSAVRVLAETAPFDYSIYYTVPLFLVFLLTIARLTERAAEDLAVEKRHRLAAALLLAEVVLLGVTIVPIGGGRDVKFSTPWGSIYLASQDAGTARQIYDFMLEQKAHGRRVLLVPELPMMYALTGTDAPSRWYSTVVTYMSPEQEKRYIDELELKRPDFVIECNWLAHRHSAGFDLVFGTDYYRSLYRWIQNNYRVTAELGHFKRGNGRYLAALVYKARDAEAVENR